METTLKGQKGVLLMVKLVTLFCVDHGKMTKESWKIMEKSWNLIPGNRWEPFMNKSQIPPTI